MNTRFLCQELRAVGWQVLKVRLISNLFCYSRWFSKLLSLARFARFTLDVRMDGCILPSWHMQSSLSMPHKPASSLDWSYRRESVP